MQTCNAIFFNHLKLREKIKKKVSKSFEVSNILCQKPNQLMIVRKFCRTELNFRSITNGNTVKIEHCGRSSYLLMLYNDVQLGDRFCVCLFFIFSMNDCLRRNQDEFLEEFGQQFPHYLSLPFPNPKSKKKCPNKFALKTAIE